MKPPPSGRGDVIVTRPKAQEDLMGRRQKELIREGDYAAEVEVELIESDGGWSPYFSLEDAQKLDAVREALRRGDLDAASKVARVFRLTPAST